MQLNNLRRGTGIVLLLVGLFLTPVSFVLAASPLLDEISVSTVQIKKVVAKNFVLDAGEKKFTVPVKTLKSFVSLTKQEGLRRGYAVVFLAADSESSLDQDQTAAKSRFCSIY